MTIFYPSSDIQSDDTCALKYTGSTHSFYNSVHHNNNVIINNHHEPPYRNHDIPLQPMIDSTDLYLNNDYPTLKYDLHTNGYLLLRNIIDVKQINNAKNTIIDTLYQQFGCIQRNDIEAAHNNASQRAYVKHAASDSMILTGYTELQHNSTILNISQHHTIYGILSKLHNNHAFTTYDNKWIRCIAPNRATDIHTDYYRFHQWSENRNIESSMYTVWIPLDHYRSDQHGTLCVCSGSHNYVKQCNYPQFTDIELPDNFYQHTINHSLQWCTTDFNPGDLVIFDIGLVHCSTINHTNEYRISIDTRWKLTDSIAIERTHSYIYS